MTTKQFSLQDVKVSSDENFKFAIADIYALASGNNSHHNPISSEVLHKCADTFKNALVIGQYDKYRGDVMSHERQEAIWGFVPAEEEIRFEKKKVDGEEKEFVVVRAYISKLYAKEVVDIFRTINERSVSCEFSCQLQYPEDELGRPLDDMGNVMNCDNPILAYNITGITILGRTVNPSVKGANMIIKKFSEKVDADKYESNLQELIKKYSEVKMEEVKEEVLTETEPQVEEFAEEKKDEVEEPTEIVMEEKDEEVKEEETEVKEEAEAEPVEEVKEEAVEVEVEEIEAPQTNTIADEPEQVGEDEVDAHEVENEVELEKEETLCDKAIGFANEEDKEFVEKFFSADVETMVKEVVELKKFMDARIKADTEKKFNEIMIGAKLNLSKKAYSELFEEGKNLKLEELGAFENKVKAFAFDELAKMRKSNDDEFMRFASGDMNIGVVENDLDSLIKKYSK